MMTKYACIHVSNREETVEYKPIFCFVSINLSDAAVDHVLQAVAPLQWR